MRYARAKDTGNTGNILYFEACTTGNTLGTRVGTPGTFRVLLSGNAIPALRPAVRGIAPSRARGSSELPGSCLPVSIAHAVYQGSRIESPKRKRLRDFQPNSQSVLAMDRIRSVRLVLRWRPSRVRQCLTTMRSHDRSELSLLPRVDRDRG